MSIKDGIAMIDFVTNSMAQKHIEENKSDEFEEVERKEEAEHKDEVKNEI